MSSPPPRSWHVASWPALAWLETLLKLAALVIGINAGLQTLANPDFNLPAGLGLVEFIILIILSMGLLAAVFDRWVEREVIAMVFVVINNLGHWGMVISLAAFPGLDSMMLWFAGFMLLGDLVKLVFIRVHMFTVRAYSSSTLIGLTAVYLLGYLTLFILALLR